MADFPVKRQTFGATVRGRGHLRDNKPNQDDYCILSDEEKSVYVAVVSDGAGSAVNSQIGSHECVQFLAKRFLQIGLDFASKDLHPKLVRGRIDQAISDHIANLKLKGGPLRDYHHTLSAAIVDSTGGGLIIQIGDSPVVVTYGGARDVTNASVNLSSLFAAESHKVFDEQKSEYANETHFVTQPNWPEHLRVVPLLQSDGVSAIFLMTDGAGAAYISRGVVHQPSMLATLREVLASPDDASAIIEKYINHPDLDNITADDKTFVAIIPTTWFNSQQSLPADITETFAQLGSVPPASPAQSLNQIGHQVPVVVTPLKSASPQEITSSKPIESDATQITQPKPYRSQGIEAPPYFPDQSRVTKSGQVEPVRAPHSVRGGEKKTSALNSTQFISGALVGILAVVVAGMFLFAYVQMSNKQNIDSDQPPEGRTKNSASTSQVVGSNVSANTGEVVQAVGRGASNLATGEKQVPKNADDETVAEQAAALKIAQEVAKQETMKRIAAEKVARQETMKRIAAEKNAKKPTSAPAAGSKVKETENNVEKGIDRNKIEKSLSSPTPIESSNNGASSPEIGSHPSGPTNTTPSGN